MTFDSVIIIIIATDLYTILDGESINYPTNPTNDRIIELSVRYGAHISAGAVGVEG